MSSYSYEIIDSTSKINESEWNNVLQSSEYATVFHNLGYLQSIEQGLRRDAAHVLAYKDGNLVGLLPNFLHPVGKGTPFKRIVSLQPGSGAPVLTGGELDVLETILDGIHNFAEGMVVSHTIRSPVPAHLVTNGYLSDHGYRAIPGSRFEIDFEKNWETIRSNMSKDRRYDLRKANEQPYQILDLEISQENLDLYYNEYSKKMDELDKPTKPRRFYENLFRESDENIKLFAAEVDEEIRGFHFYFLDEYQSTIRHQWMAVLRENFEYYPGELLHEHAIKWGINNGYSRYDFGGGKADLRSGTTKYKQQFGGDIVPFTSWEKEFSNVFKVGRFISRRL